MQVAKPKQNRFQMSYRKQEANAFLEMEQSLMQDLCIPTRCELHRTAIKNMYQQRQQLMLNLLWENHEYQTLTSACSDAQRSGKEETWITSRVRRKGDKKTLWILTQRNAHFWRQCQRECKVDFNRAACLKDEPRGLQKIHSKNQSKVSWCLQ